MAKIAKAIVKKLLPKSTRGYLRYQKESLENRYQHFLNATIGQFAGGHEDAIAMLHGSLALTPDLIIRAYAYGIFPAPEENAASWVDPPLRTTIPVEGYHIGSRLKSYIRKQMFTITLNQNFAGVLDGCAETKEGRETTWITPQIKEVYLELHRMGVSHSVEAWEDGELVGGLMGISIGAFFATESLFYRTPQASKIAFAHLCAALKLGGYQLHDMQMPSGVSEQFGSVTLTRTAYKQQLANAIIGHATLKLPELSDVI